jgi:uncharacterized membrane-anchored protein YjiN (DUF445 family)
MMTNGVRCNPLMNHSLRRLRTLSKKIIAKLEKDESQEELKKKVEEIKRLCKHNQEILNNVKKVKKQLQEPESKNRDEYITTKIEEDTTKNLDKEICKKVEKSLNINEVKSKMQSTIE